MGFLSNYEIFSYYCYNSLQTRLPVYACSQSGASTNQLMHYAELAKYGHFGQFVFDIINPAAFKNTNNYTLSNITAPITLHYSLGDATFSLEQLAKLSSKVNSIVYKQVVSEPTFAHGDFTLGMTANELVYKYIVYAFENYGR